MNEIDKSIDTHSHSNDEDIKCVCLNSPIQRRYHYSLQYYNMATGSAFDIYVTHHFHLLLMKFYGRPRAKK